MIKDTTLSPTAPKLESRIVQQVVRLQAKVERRAQSALQLLREGDHMVRVSDRATMAKNLWTILEEVASRGIQKKRVMEQAGILDSNAKSGRLYEYSLDPSLEEDAQKKRWARLVRKASGYLRIAEAAATLGKLDLSTTILRLVSGTRFEPGMESVAGETEAEHFDMLYRIIQAQSRRIAENTNLTWYFETIDKQGLSPNGDSWEADDQAWIWTYTTLPSVALFTEEIACFAGLWWEKGSDKAAPKLVRVCRQVRLSLAPFGENKAVLPYFVRRPVILVSNPRKGSVDKPSDPLHLDFSYPMVFGLPDGEGHIFASRGTLKVEDPEGVRNTALAPAADLPGEDYEFIPVTPATMREVFELGLSVEWWTEEDRLWRAAAAFTKSPAGTLTAALERALLYGASVDYPNSRLMAELEEAAKERVEGLRRFAQAAIADIDALAETLINT